MLASISTQVLRAGMAGMSWDRVITFASPLHGLISTSFFSSPFLVLQHPHSRSWLASSIPEAVWAHTPGAPSSRALSEPGTAAARAMCQHLRAETASAASAAGLEPCSGKPLAPATRPGSPSRGAGRSASEGGGIGRGRGGPRGGEQAERRPWRQGGPEREAGELELPLTLSAAGEAAQRLRRLVRRSE